jgi:8-oxo-dGTP pyrophosphatase MutT (NUDIX family)
MERQLTHAGAVAFRHYAGGVHYLVVSSSDGKHRVLPKGHIKRRETPEQCALRELREEAGVTGEIVATLTSAQYTVPRETVSVRYYLVRATGDAGADEARELEWLDAADALLRLDFDDAREAVRHAAGFLSRTNP